MVEWFRTFLIIVEEGSLNRAATRLHVTQPTLTRRMQALENGIGGPLLERQPSGVRPTALGRAVMSGMRPLLEQYETVLAGLRRTARRMPGGGTRAGPPVTKKFRR